MTESAVAIDRKTAARFVLSGRVQGHGVRPAIARLATELNLAGHVSNELHGVLVHVEGEPARIDEFARRIDDVLPAAAMPREVARSKSVVAGFTNFEIDSGGEVGTLATEVPRDLVVCDDCLREVTDSRSRRGSYAFTSCTNCGPRYSIIQRMPFERVDTAMHDFALCPACHGEFASLADRRFHAQTNACPDCGPILQAMTADGKVVAKNAAAIAEATAVLHRGGIMALKGIGGYQLLCDATNPDAVQTLRQRKRRPAKPLAVMIKAETTRWFLESDRVSFLNAANPIVVLSAESMRRLSRATDPVILGLLTNGQLAPGMNTLGVFRPTTPLHASLINATGKPLVVTSGNADGDPLAFDDNAAVRGLSPIVDLILLHDRRIFRPIDDSLVRVIGRRTVTLRAARGIAPLPLSFSSLQVSPRLLAAGSHQKAAIALCNGRQCVLGPHVGDLESLATRERYLQQVQHLLELYRSEPEAIVCDLHPDYFTARWAEQEAERRQIPLIRVQHHHAHIAAGMLEHGWLDRAVLGVAFDGTGYGADGTVWGGEFLRATATDFQRVASLRPFALTGGDRAIREPWRVAVALLGQVLDDVDQLAKALPQILTVQQVAATVGLARSPLTPVCTSMGRLFDGVASIILEAEDAQFEGELAMRLEAVCDLDASGSYELPLEETSALPQLDWRPLVRQLVEDLHSGESAGTMSMRFHRAVAAGVECVARHYEMLPVVLGGGCFQNRMLTELIADRLQARNQPIGLPGTIPPNDGGLAAGQLAIGLARLGDTICPREASPCA